MHRLLEIPVLSSMILAFVSGEALSAQVVGSEDRTVWNGVFTREQSVRGQERFESACSGCHRSGGNGAPELAGEAFLEDWREDNLGSLFGRIRNSMPPDAPSSLPEEAYLEIVAFMLDSNGFPAGDRALETDGIENIRVEGRDGPGPVPDFALVEVMGCLGRSADGNWLVSQAREPVRTRDPVATADGELEVVPLGNATFELIYVYPDPEPYDGHRVVVKGFLIRDTDPDRINVSSVASIVAGCGR